MVQLYTSKKAEAVISAKKGTVKMLFKITKQKLIDYFIISVMLAFCIGIVIVNFGEYPLLEVVTATNLAATAVYTLFWALFIYLTAVLRRRYAALFARVFMTVCLLFQVWFVLATASVTTFIPSFLTRLFSLLTVALNNPFIGLYFFIGRSDGFTYALVSSLIIFALCAFSWILWLSDVGYFNALRLKIASRPKKKTRAQTLKEEILELRKQKFSQSQTKDKDGEN
jgi:uncharacterized membrane protein YGL010W